MRSRVILLLFCVTGAWTFPIGPAGAMDAPLFLFLCDPEILGDAGECDRLHEAIEAELSDFGLDVLSQDVEESMPCDASEEILEDTRQAGAAGAAWVCLVPSGEPTARLAVHAPGTLQEVSTIALVEDAGALDPTDVAFRLHHLVGASMFIELDGITGEDILLDSVSAPEIPHVASVALAPGPPRWKSPVPALDPELDPGLAIEIHHAPGPRHAFEVDIEYALMGYPLEGMWFHGITLRGGVALLPGLKLFVDASLGLSPERFQTSLQTTGELLRLENRQYVVGVGIGYSAVLARILTLVPMGGFHLGVSDSRVTAGNVGRHRAVNTALWAGLELRVWPASRVALTLGAIVENLFNYENIEWQTLAGTREVMTLSQLRVQVLAGLVLGF